jgi:hypothetical protein
MPDEWRRSAWACSPAEVRNQIFAERAAAAGMIRSPDPLEAATLWSQYHALKALAVRLDAGLGGEREREMFEAGLRIYDANFDHIRLGRLGRKALTA